MKNLRRLITQYKNIYAKVSQENDSVFCLEGVGDPSQFSKQAFKWFETKIPVHDELDEAFNAILPKLYQGFFLSNSDIELRWFTVIYAFMRFGYLPFYSEDKKHLFIFKIGEGQFSIDEIIKRINTFYEREFQNSIKFVSYTQNEIEKIYQKILDAEDFYLTKNGAYTQELINNLGDEISKISFRDFLRQRIVGHIHWNALAMYPIEAPKATSAWREERQKREYNLPVLNHCSKWERLFFYNSSFILEQYGIEGVVGAKEGDIVIDAGAFIADTALYFSQKIGNSGKVYAFEALPHNAEHAKDNVKTNNCRNVEVVPMALTYKTQKMYFVLDEVSNGASHIADDTASEKQIEVSGTSLDDFAKEHAIKVGFIKSDIEGCEMDLLLGAKETIKRDKPTCGLTVYHKQDDYIKIPQYLSSLCPEYQYYFRCETEPVLFAAVTK